MGITLHGIIEAWVDREQGRSGWENFATVEFNKNYELFSALQEYANDRKRHWLSGYAGDGKRLNEDELSWDAREVIDQDISSDGFWVTADELETGLKNEPSYDVGYDWRATAGAALAFMRHFEKSWPKVRLLLYRIT
jgi:hypothetical protein